MEVVMVEGIKHIPLWQCILFFVAGGIAMFGAGFCCCGLLCSNRRGDRLSEEWRPSDGV
jgi:hypothetical protein